MVCSNRIKCIHLEWANRTSIDINHPNLIAFIRGDRKYLCSSLPDPKFSGRNDGPPWPCCCGDDVVTLSRRNAGSHPCEDDKSDQEINQATVHGRDWW